MPQNYLLSTGWQVRQIALSGVMALAALFFLFFFNTLQMVLDGYPFMLIPRLARRIFIFALRLIAVFFNFKGDCMKLFAKWFLLVVSVLEFQCLFFERVFNFVRVHKLLFDCTVQCDFPIILIFKPASTLSTLIFLSTRQFLLRAVPSSIPK